MRRLAFVILILSSVIGTPLRSFATDSVESLRSELEAIFADGRFADAQWGVKVVSLEHSETLFEKNALQLYIPASNNKIITAASALIRLGPQFRFETRILADGPIRNGVLRGNLIVKGSGDPSNSQLFQPENPFAVFKEWASKLQELGIRNIKGNILGDTGAFDENKLGKGWEWDDLVQAYAAPISALQFNDNSIEVEISPGGAEGSSPSIWASPLTGYLTIENKLLTGPEDSSVAIRVKQGRSMESIILSGSIPLHSPAEILTIAAQSPVRYYLSALKHTLTEQGINTSDCAIMEKRNYASPSLSLLWSHSSLELSEILRPLLKESMNLYAETLTRTLGYTFLGQGTFSKGRQIIEETLEEMGIAKGSYSYADASGLSRLNLASADTLVQILKYMHGHSYFESFYNALPLAGIDGTLKHRLRNTSAMNNLRAKTGTIANVSAISGYLKSADGEMLAFSMIANNFLVDRREAEQLQNRAIERLASFSRK
jgi:D-alanyl-D-alanine carboxypeptidase/D-alanyl-D-alanine-endopeptidase (penicillin-binding protein 4)